MVLFIECIIAISLFTIIVMTVALITPKYIVGDYPPEIIKKCIELKIIPERKTRFTKKEIIKKVIACILFVIVLAYIVYKFNGANTFASGLINSYIIRSVSKMKRMTLLFLYVNSISLILLDIISKIIDYK